MGKISKNVIDYYDLKIPIASHMNQQVALSLQEFEDHHDYIVIHPKLKNGVLKINSTDLISFLGYFDSSMISEMDRRRISAAAEDQMHQYINKTVSSDYRSHYQWCLAALKNLDWGRYKTGS